MRLRCLAAFRIGVVQARAESTSRAAHNCSFVSGLPKIILTKAMLVSNDSLISEFSELAAAGRAPGGVVLPHAWSMADWAEFFGCGEIRRVPAGEALIRKGDPERTLFFVLKGSLEVISHSGHGLSLGALSK